MAYCPVCKGKVGENARDCPHCGKRVIPAESIEKMPSKITPWQWVVIAVSIIILIFIAFTFEGAEQREDAAAEKNFIGSTRSIIYAVSEHGGLTAEFGKPEFTLRAKTHGARVYIEYPAGPLAREQARTLGKSVAASLARSYVKKGYAPRFIEVTVVSRLPNQRVINYGKAVFNGDKGDLLWVPAGRNK